MRVVEYDVPHGRVEGELVALGAETVGEGDGLLQLVAQHELIRRRPARFPTTDSTPARRRLPARLLDGSRVCTISSAVSVQARCLVTRTHKYVVHEWGEYREPARF